MCECLNSVSLFLCSCMYCYFCYAYNSHSGYMCAINIILFYYILFYDKSCSYCNTLHCGFSFLVVSELKFQISLFLFGPLLRLHRVSFHLFI